MNTSQRQPETRGIRKINVFMLRQAKLDLKNIRGLVQSACVWGYAICILTSSVFRRSHSKKIKQTRNYCARFAFHNTVIPFRDECFSQLAALIKAFTGRWLAVERFRLQRFFHMWRWNKFILPSSAEPAKPLSAGGFKNFLISLSNALDKRYTFMTFVLLKSIIRNIARLMLACGLRGKGL